MKRIISIFLLSLILLKIGGFLAILSIEREIIHEKVIQKIVNNEISKELTCIIGSEENLTKIEWEREQKEFWYEGKLYDIVKTETKNGLIYYYCLADFDEQLIVSRYKNLTQGQNEHVPLNETSKNILQLIFEQVVLIHDLHPHFNTNINKTQQKFPPLFSFYISSYFSRIFAPPKFI